MNRNEIESISFTLNYINIWKRFLSHCFINFSLKAMMFMMISSMLALIMLESFVSFLNLGIFMRVSLFTSSHCFRCLCKHCGFHDSLIVIALGFHFVCRQRGKKIMPFFFVCVLFFILFEKKKKEKIFRKRSLFHKWNQRKAGYSLILRKSRNIVITVTFAGFYARPLLTQKKKKTKNVP